MKKKKFIVFMPTVNAGGGVEKNFFIITNYLCSKLSKITVITLSRSAKQKLNKRIRVICPKINFIENLGRRAKFLISLIFLFKEIIDNKNSTVICFQGIIYCTLLCKITGTKVIIRSNSSPSGWSKNFLKKFFYKKIYGLADKIIVNSLFFKKELKQKFNLKSVCIYNPLDKKEIYRDSQKKIKIDFYKKKSLNIISVARFSDQKDHDCLIKSINVLKDEYYLKLILLGSGPLKDKIFQRIKELKLSKIIKIIDFKKNPYPLINKSELFILSSRYEGSPNVLLEAISLKKFVISSDCPTGPREILDNGKGGILFRPGDYRMLSNKIIFYIKNKKRLEKKKIYAFKRLSRFNYNERLKDYHEALINF
tara:strand:- start:13890 stop:14987 length:1098 start_codon:yes stop_codon:yes gene_type:complete